MQEHPWLTKGGREPLPRTTEHCVTIEINDEDVKNSVTLLSKLSSLVSIVLHCICLSVEATQD